MIRKMSTILAFSFILIIGVNCGGTSTRGGPIDDTFDSAGRWATGYEDGVSADIEDGRLKMVVTFANGLFWSEADLELSHGTYEIDVTQTEGPLNNGFGLMLFVDDDTGDLILFEVSGDGFVWIGRCAGNCSEDLIPFTEGGWIESDAVHTGLGQLNRLRVETSETGMMFFVNDELVLESDDTVLSNGDVGLAIETLGQGGVGVEFDNFRFRPGAESAESFGD